ncbi:MAG: putative protein YhcH [Myxococcota bacterium]|nr:putative protein YhcH [Myxococcota bacterium]
MILDTLDNAGKYPLGDRFRAAFAWLSNSDLNVLAPGKYDIQGEDVFAIVQHYETKPRARGAWEAHRQYHDIQYVFEGAERMGWSPLQGKPVVKEYDPGNDYLLVDGAGQFVEVPAGSFAIFSPQDAHMPGIQVEDARPVKKVVVKVRV